MLPYRVRTKTSRVVVHASHTPPDKSNLEAFLAVNGRTQGLLSIGYHFLILQDGRLVECRPHNVQGTHIRGKANRDSIGVCLAGGREAVTCTDCMGTGSTHHPDDLANWNSCYACAGTGSVQDPADNFKPAQFDTLGHLMAYLAQFYGKLPLVGHSELRPGHPHQCPPTDMEKVRAWSSSRTPLSPPQLASASGLPSAWCS